MDEYSFSNYDNLSYMHMIGERKIRLGKKEYRRLGGDPLDVCVTGNR